MEADATGEKISVYRSGLAKPLLTQNAGAQFRPYLHPITAPDGKGQLTQFSPGHHKHQTGLYWGLTRVNGRDYFHHPGKGYWQRVSARIGKKEGPQVSCLARMVLPCSEKHRNGRCTLQAPVK